MGDNDEIKKTAPEEVIAAGGVSRNRRSAGVARYANYRRRRNKESKDVRRSTSSPCPFRDSSTSEMEDEDDDHRTVRKSPSMPQTAAGLEPPVPAVRRPKPLRPKRDDKQSDAEKSEPEKPTTPEEQKESDKSDQKKGVKAVQKEKKSKAKQSDGSKSDGERELAEESSEGWWKNLSNWKRSKSLEPETLEALEQMTAPPRRKSLHRAEEEVPEPELRRRKKTKELNTTDDMKLDDTVDDFWKTEMSKLSGQDEEKAKETEVKKEKDSNEDLRSVGSEQITKKDIQEFNLESTEVTETKDIKNVDEPIIQEPCIIEEPYIKEKPISWLEFYKQIRIQYRQFVKDNPVDAEKMRLLRNRCINDFIILFIYCGLGAFMFKFTESAFETFYKCGVKRVKRDFIDQLWRESHYLKEEEWKSNARRKLMEFENQLHEAFEAGMTSYSGQKSWSFLNAVIYCLTVVSTIGYGHIAPATNTGRALTIIYAIFGIPMFLILLADFGKMFTRGIKWIWAFVRRLYYTGSCKKVRKTGPVQEVMKGVQVMYDMATFRRPSQMGDGIDPTKEGEGTPHSPMSGEPPSTPAPSNFAIDDEFNLPVSLAITILLMYILCGAAVFYVWEENWSFFESFYFVFISMSTIGFGDFVPQNKMYMMASIVYLAFGLALTTMCINVVQEKLSDTFRQATAKIGATIGLRVSEEDGTVTPATPAHVELVQVHKSPSQL